MVDITVIAATTPNWLVLTKGNVSPTRELDRKAIPVGDLGSYAMTFEVINNNPSSVGDLSRANRSLDFIHITLLMKFNDIDLAESFCNLANITHISYTDRQSKVYAVGSVRQWANLLFAFLCNDDRFEQFRVTLDKIYIILCDLGFKTLFGNKNTLEDGTFYLKDK